MSSSKIVKDDTKGRADRIRQLKEEIQKLELEELNEATKGILKRKASREPAKIVKKQKSDYNYVMTTLNNSFPIMRAQKEFDGYLDSFDENEVDNYLLNLSSEMKRREITMTADEFCKCFTGKNRHGEYAIFGYMIISKDKRCMKFREMMKETLDFFVWTQPHEFIKFKKNNDCDYASTTYTIIVVDEE